MYDSPNHGHSSVIAHMHKNVAAIFDLAVEAARTLTQVCIQSPDLFENHCQDLMQPSSLEAARRWNLELKSTAHDVLSALSSGLNKRCSLKDYCRHEPSHFTGILFIFLLCSTLARVSSSACKLALTHRIGRLPLKQLGTSPMDLQDVPQAAP